MLYLNPVVKFPSFPEVFPHVCVLPPARPPSFAQLYETGSLRRKGYTRSNIFLPALKSSITSAAAPAFSFEFNRDLEGRWEAGNTTESGALRAVSISEEACGGEEAWANEDNQEVSEASLEKLEFKTISA